MIAVTRGSRAGAWACTRAAAAARTNGAIAPDEPPWITFMEPSLRLEALQVDRREHASRVLVPPFFQHRAVGRSKEQLVVEHQEVWLCARGERRKYEQPAERKGGCAGRHH